MAEEMATALEEGDWTSAVRVEVRKPPEDVPLLENARIRVSFRYLSVLVERLARAAAKGAPRDSTARWLENSILDVGQLADLLASYIGGQPIPLGATTSLVSLLAVPILVACSRYQGECENRTWSRGYCFFCGAWASLAESRGIDRSRHLRCGRCGADWVAPPLRCVYCSEADHTKLGFLEPQGELQTRKVETCATCRGYLKSVATLTPLSIVELLLCDVETVELDLAALERGYRRPGVVGHSFAVALVDDCQGDGAP